MARCTVGDGHRVGTRTAAALCAALVLAAAACGSSKAAAPGGGSSTTIGTLPKSTAPGHGVTATTIKLGVALVDFTQIRQFTDLIRSKAEQQQIYQIYIDDVNKHGGINGRKIVPDYKFYTPLGSAPLLTDCTAWAQDDDVFGVVGTFIDFSGDAQTCIAKQQQRVLLTFDLTQQIIDRSPPGLIVSPGYVPERAGTILVQLLQKQHLLQGEKIAVLGDSTVSTVVKKTVVPALRKARVSLGSTAILSVNTSGDTSAAQQQLDSYIERWKTEGVNAIYLSGEIVSSKEFVVPLTQKLPHVTLYTDATDSLQQAQQLQEQHTKPNPYEGIITAAGPTPHEYDNSANWTYCKGIYEAATGHKAPDAEHTIKTKDGKIDDTYGTINDACQVISMFHDIAVRVGKYLNNDNWINTVNSFGPIANRGSGPYSSLHAGKYGADDNWRLESYDSSLGASGLWKPITAVEDISG